MEPRAGRDEQQRRYLLERVYIGQNIHRLRVGLQMKQTELAAGVGCAQSSISRIERGQMGTSAARLSAIAAYLGVPPVLLWLPPLALAVHG